MPFPQCMMSSGQQRWRDIVTPDMEDCGYNIPQTDESTLMTIAYVMAAICALFMLPLCLMVCQWRCLRCLRHQHDDFADDISLLK